MSSILAQEMALCTIFCTLLYFVYPHLSNIYLTHVYPNASQQGFNDEVIFRLHSDI